MHRKNISLLLNICLALGFVCITKAHGQKNATEEIAVGVYSALGSKKTVDLAAEDFDLLINGKPHRIVSVNRETRPVSVVLIVVTSPWQSCIDQHQPLALGGLSKVVNNNDSVAIVVSDGECRQIRAFGDDISSLSADISRAVEAAKRNKYDEFNPESHYTEAKSGLIYPMPALKTAIDLLKKTPPKNDRLIIFVNGLQNTRTGSASEARSAFTDLIENHVTVSWLAPVESGKQFDLARFPFGKRDYFLGLPAFTGGPFQKCLKATGDYSVTWGRGKEQRYSSFEDDLNDIVQLMRNRYRITYYRENNLTGLSPVYIDLKASDKKEFHLLYPHAVKY